MHELADKVVVQEDKELTKRFPAEIPCRIDIRKHSGELTSASASFPRGHFKNPMTDAEVEDKYRQLAGRFLPKAQVDAALRLLWKIDEASDAGVVLDGLVKSRNEIV